MLTFFQRDHLSIIASRIFVVLYKNIIVHGGDFLASYLNSKKLKGYGKIITSTKIKFSCLSITVIA